MARDAHSTDLVGRLARGDEGARQLRLRQKSHTEVKTFIVGGPISTDLYVPPFFVGVNYTGTAPERKRLVGFRAVLEVGLCTLLWLLNGDLVTNAMPVSTDPQYGVYDIDPVDLATGDVVQVQVVAVSSDASNLSAAAFMVTAS